jgi:hypothetical protein
MIVRVVGAVRKRKDKCKPQQCGALLKCTLLMKKLNKFFYMHSTGKNEEQNILNLKLVLFHECKVSN